MSDNQELKPFISADKVMPEFTFTSVFAGLLLAVIFGGANAYLGLRVGMTVSASIPAAVIGMGVIRVILKKNSVLESNMIQTIGSAGESLAAGAIFTIPALFLWAAEGTGQLPTIIEITLIALAGGILGVLFMIPLRKALIVKEHGVLPYPEGTACAEVILAGEEGGSNAATVFIGMAAAALLKFIVDGLQIVSGVVTLKLNRLYTEISTEVYPALVSVGYICGVKISSYMFAGGILGWLVLIPAIMLFGIDATLFPGTVPIGEMYRTGGAGAIWGSYIRYIGAGAVAAGGIISLVKTLPLIFKTFTQAMKGMKASKGSSLGLRTDQDMKMPAILGGILVIALLITLAPSIPVNFTGALLVIIFGFFFAAVSSRMVGLVGSSNNPVSGMAIATLLISTLILKASGHTGIAGMTGAIAIGSIICIIAAMAGDTSQDLKTGYILGATPRRQQYGELLGAAVSAVAIGGILYLLNAAWGFGSTQIPAPQATLMKMLVEGVMHGSLPWTLVLIGAFIAVAIEFLGIPVLPFAIGLYLPMELTACIMVGGVLRFALERRKYKSRRQKERTISNGILCCSGMIAGEGLVGILLAVAAVIPLNQGVTLGSLIAGAGKAFQLGQGGGLLILLLILLTILRFTIWDQSKEV